MIRLFTALEIPPDIGEALARRQQGLPGARWRPGEALHITLAFYGEVTEPVADDLDAELSRVRGAPFELSLKGVGAFGDDWRARAIWAGVADSEPLTVLAGRCASAGRRAGIDPPRRDYRPHVTLAYLKPQTDPARVGAWVTGHNLLASPAFRIDRFGLYSSTLGGQGSAYQLERSYPL